jgi:ParB family transcriptional regulator, chromosome partitioning protein
MRVSLNDIKIGNRIRKDIGNIDDLINSMRRHGLLQPIVIDQNYNLVAGYRRIYAARALGWDSIEARIVEAENKKERVSMEVEENTTRRDFTPEERERARRLLDIYSQEGVFSSFIAWLFTWK